MTLVGPSDVCGAHAATLILGCSMIAMKWFGCLDTWSYVTSCSTVLRLLASKAIRMTRMTTAF